MESLSRRAARLASRALRLRCVACGARPVFTSWFRMLPNCASCGFTFERGERGYELGSYFVNIMLVETIFCLWFGGVLVATWPAVNWELLQSGTIALMIVSPFACHPWSRTLFLAFDLLVRPPNEEDFHAPEERAAKLRPKA